MPRLPFLLLLGLFSALASPASAQLKWENPWQEFNRDPEDESVEATFRFTNAGTGPVTVKSVKTSCGCTTAKLEQKTYLPGQSGAVVADFRFGSRTGDQRKIITVKTEDGAQQELNIVVYIRKAMSLSPGLVHWKSGTPAAPQAVTLQAEPGQKINVTGVTSPSPHFSVQLETIAPGTQYRVLVTPASTASREKTEIRIQTDYPADAPRAYTIFARIK